MTEMPPATGRPVTSQTEAAPAAAVTASSEQPKRRGRGCLILVVVMLVLLVIAALVIPIVAVVVLSSGDTPAVSGGNIALIRINGVITASGSDAGLLSAGGTSSESVLEQIDRADSNPRIKAILLRIDSPGGTAAGGQEIADAVRDADKPVVASIADMGASAAYMIAAQADHIVSTRSGLVGSIGVIMEIPNYEGLYKKIGVKVITLHAGKYKDIGNPSRPMLPEERKFLEEMLEVVHEQFIEDVAAGRDMDVSEVRKLATGLFWTGSQAKDLGLVDEVGGYKEGLAAAAELGGVKGNAKVVEMKQDSFWDVLSGDFSTKLAQAFVRELAPDTAAPRVR